MDKQLSRHHQSDRITFTVSLYNPACSLNPFYATPMLHAYHPFIVTREQIGEDVLVVNLTGGWLIASRVISHMEG